MMQRPHFPLDAYEGSLVRRLCVSMGLTPNTKRQRLTRVLESPEILEQRAMLSATSSDQVQVGYQVSNASESTSMDQPAESDQDGCEPD
ncbi:MAG: hypothetical protein V4719_07900 [Planctomycetota bacterium]